MLFFMHYDISTPSFIICVSNKKSKVKRRTVRTSGQRNVRKKISHHPLREEGQPRRGHGYQRPKSRLDLCVCEADFKMSDTIEEKIKNYRTAPFDARFPNTNQTRNCFQNYLDYHRCNKALDAKGQDLTPCQWYMRVYKSLCPMSWVAKWDDQIENGSFPGKI